MIANVLLSTKTDHIRFLQSENLIGHHNLFHFNVHNDIMSRKNVNSDYKFIISNKTDQIRFWKIKGLNYVHLIRSIVHLNSALCA